MAQAPSTLPWAALAMAELLRLRASARAHLPNAHSHRPNIQPHIKRKPNRVAKLPKGGIKMPQYTLLSTCERCGEQVVNKTDIGNAHIYHVSGLAYNSYVFPIGCSSNGAYLCLECHKQALEMEARHKKERREFCNQ
jgi:hypothetical protein